MIKLSCCKNYYLWISICFFLFVVLLGFIGVSKIQIVNRTIFSIINPYNPLMEKPIESHSKFPNDYWTDPRGIFPIFAYNLPDNTNDLTTSLKIIEEGGINIIINGNLGWMPDPLKLKEAFNNLKNSNLRWIAIIENECKNDFIFNNSNDATNGNIRRYLELFNDDFIYGWYIWDEPGKNRKPCSSFNLIPNNDFEDINRMVKQIRSDSIFSSKLDFINLFPNYWDLIKNNDDYEKYLNAFYSSQEFKPRVLCVDFYPFLKPEYGGFRNKYYANLEILRKKSIEWEIPFWMIVLSSGHDYYKNPTSEEISFQVYSSLAYGAKGIGYYLYSKSFQQIGYRSWILENFSDKANVPDSLQNEMYKKVKVLNLEISNIGKMLLNTKSIGLFHTSTHPNDQISFNLNLLDKSFNLDEVLDTVSINREKSHLIFSFFRSNNAPDNEFLILVVNKDYKSDILLNLTFKEKVLLKTFDKLIGKFNEIKKTNNLSLKISAGSGELFYITNSEVIK